MENPVRETTLEVVKKLKEVKINQEKIKEVAKSWVKEGVKVPAWPVEYSLKTDNAQKMLDYLIILDSLNFCYWPASALRVPAGKNKKRRWEFFYKGEKYNGYFAWSLALKKFFEENPGKGNLDYFSKISFKNFKEILQGGANLQLLKKRWEIAQKVSCALIEKYGDSLNFLESSKGKASLLLPKIYKELPYFDDFSFCRGKKVYFLKRAQILISEIYGAFSGRDFGHFEDLGYLTCFPDYKVPQILNNLGILEYSQGLERKIKNKVLIPAGSPEETEIRSATVWAVEYLEREMTELGKEFYAFQVDWILWDKSHKDEMKNPYHLTKTIFY